MEYRNFGQLDWKVSALGFGTMRFPVLDGDSSKIDEPQAMKMVRDAIDAGVNYIDTAWGYHREQSEPFVGSVLADGYRERVKLATKMPSWLVMAPEDLDKYFNIQLERLQTDYIDCYLLHTLNKRYWDNYLRLNIFDWLEKKKDEGKIRAVGFSFHDKYEVFEEIVTAYDHWDFCQIQYNYVDIEEQAGLKGLKLAADKGLAIIIMEPLRGGGLASPKLPPTVEEVFARSERPWSHVEWALQWLWDQPEVSLVLSGMSTPEQVAQNLTFASRSAVGQLSDADRQLIIDAHKAMRAVSPIPCTKCEYCLPCPQGVRIPSIFSVYNDAMMFNLQAYGQRNYGISIPTDGKADQCVECGACEELCPQQIEIIESLKVAHEYLTEPLND